MDITDTDSIPETVRRDYQRLCFLAGQGDQEAERQLGELEARIETLTAGLADRFPPEIHIRVTGSWPVAVRPILDDHPSEVSRREHLHQKFDADLELTDEPTRALLRAFLERFVRWIEREGRGGRGGRGGGEGAERRPLLKRLSAEPR